jgi:hypothetical protein
MASIQRNRASRSPLCSKQATRSRFEAKLGSNNRYCQRNRREHSTRLALSDPIRSVPGNRDSRIRKGKRRHNLGRHLNLGFGESKTCWVAEEHTLIARTARRLSSAARAYHKFQSSSRTHTRCCRLTNEESGD